MVKLKKFVTKIGISYPEAIELKNNTPEKLILPCHLGILFYGDFDINLFEQIESYLNYIYDSFFFEIRNLGLFNFSRDLYSRGIKKEYKELRKTNNKLSIHPTNKFYRLLIEKRIEEKLGMIIALTDLPIYSSSEVDILFLFGETHLKHRCSIVSTLKLKESFYNRKKDQNLFFQRMIKEVIHEIGHIILNSEHCKVNSCVMKFSKTVEEVDEKSYEFCSTCKGKLSKVRNQFNF
jgi:predicted Zn-dependent protease